MFGSKRVTVAGQGDLHGQSGKRVGTSRITDPDTGVTKTYTEVLLDGDGHSQPIPPGNLTREKKGR